VDVQLLYIHVMVNVALAHRHRMKPAFDFHIGPVLRHEMNFLPTLLLVVVGAGRLVLLLFVVVVLVVVVVSSLLFLLLLFVDRIL
jgi:hypothetical protein